MYKKAVVRALAASSLLLFGLGITSAVGLGRNAGPFERQTAAVRSESDLRRTSHGASRNRAALTPAASIGPTTADDLLYVPMNPCRVADTRVAGGAMSPNEARNFVIAGTDLFVEQGGTPGGCGIPLGLAAAVAVNVTGVQPDGAAFVRAWPTGSPEPDGGTFLNVSPALFATAGTPLAICEIWLASCDFDLTVKMFGASSQLVIDITGFYVYPTFAEVDGSGTPTNGSFPFLNSAKTGTGVYTVDFFRVVDNCGYSATIVSSSTSTPPDPGFATVQVSSTAGRVTVRTYSGTGAAADRPFHVTMLC